MTEGQANAQLGDGVVERDVVRVLATFATAEGMMRWRKRIFSGLAHNAANPAAAFCLPEDRTVVMGAHVEL